MTFLAFSLSFQDINLLFTINGTAQKNETQYTTEIRNQEISLISDFDSVFCPFLLPNRTQSIHSIQPIVLSTRTHDNSTHGQALLNVRILLVFAR